MLEFPLSLDPLSEHLLRFGDTEVLRHEEQMDLIRRYQRGDQGAGLRVLRANQRFVAARVARWSSERIRNGDHLRDLLSEANIGLLKAMRRFDPDRGFQFLSYAHFWIDAMVMKYMSDTHSLVKVGTDKVNRKLFYQLPAARRANPTASDEDLDRILGYPPGSVAEHVRRIRGDLSLDHPLGKESHHENTLIDILVDDSPSAEDVLLREERITGFGSFEILLEQLDERSRVVLHRRMFLDPPDTLEAIGRDLGYTRECIRIVERKALAKLRFLIRKRKWKGEEDLCAR